MEFPPEDEEHQEQQLSKAVPKTVWKWELTDPNRNGSSGDLSKLFRNEAIKQPGVFSKDAPSGQATVVAREVIQNSWDAAKELQQHDGDDAPPFEIEFVFRQVSGAKKQSLSEALDLNTLARHAARHDRHQMGLDSKDCLTSLAGKVPLKVLEVRESGTTGMYGPFVGASSKLFLALISVGYTVKQSGSGGSYGFGKAGLIRGSAIRTVIAYTCFRETKDDPGVTRRLLGMTYWGQHGKGNKSFTGFARFGFNAVDATVPYENAQADEVAKRLGIATRDASNPQDLGTTFLLVDPTVEPDDLLCAVERNWWPALLGEDDFTVRVQGYDGKESIPRPKKNDAISPFIRAYELAQTAQDNTVPHEFRTEVRGAGHRKLGRLGLVADLTGWSYPDDSKEYEKRDEDETETRSSSLVALIRSPQMVVEYHEVGQSVPLVRGVFIADPAVDDLLRQTEPKTHDAWQTKITEIGIDPAAPRVAKSVLVGIVRSVNAFRRMLKPPQPRPEDINLPILRDLFSRLVDGKGAAQKPPPRVPRDVTIELSQRVKVGTNASSVRLEATVDFGLSAGYALSDNVEAGVVIEYRFIEDERVGERCPVKIVAPGNFTELVPGRWRGTLGRKPVRFRVTSEQYDRDWTGRLLASAEVINQPSKRGSQVTS